MERTTWDSPKGKREKADRVMSIQRLTKSSIAAFGVHSAGGYPSCYVILEDHTGGAKSVSLYKTSGNDVYS